MRKIQNWPKMVASKAVLDAALELPNIAAPIGAALNSDAMALAVTPLPGEGIPCVKPVNSIAMPQPLPVLTFVPTSSRPALNPVAVVPPIDPIPLVSSINEEIVNSAAITPSFVELSLVEIAIAVELHSFSNNPPRIRRLRLRLADEPLDRLRILSVLWDQRVLDDRDALVDQALVLVRQEERNGDED